MNRKARLLPLFTVLLLMGALLPGRSPAATPVTVMVLGDSLSIGYGLGPGESWVDQAGAALASENVTVRMVNASVSGDTMADGRARLGWALAEQPDVCIVALGGNDGLRMLDTTRMERSLDAIILELLEHDITPVIAGMLPPPNYGPEYSESFSAVFARVAAAREVELVPFLLEGVAGEPGLNQADGIHPTAEGASVVAGTMLPVIRSAVHAVMNGHTQRADSK